MIKTLMHKNTPVVSMRISSTGALEEIVRVFDESLLPERGEDTTRAMQRWLLLRGTSTARKDIQPLREFYGSKMFTSVNMRSLFDTYWLKVSADETWDSVNAFDNWDPDDDDIFLALLYPRDFEGPRYDSPNLTVPGSLERIWYKDETHSLGIICSDAQKEMSEYNIAKKNNISIVKPKSYFILGGTIFTYEMASTSKDIEQVSFDSLYNASEDKSLDKMENLQKCCETFHIPEWEGFLNEMLTFDELCGKEDRELSDIKVLRDADTLRILGFDKL